MNDCSDSNASPDGILCKLLKAVSHFIICPFNVANQQSLYAGKFPTMWKKAVDIPLYKGRGDCSAASSYRPVNLCPCLSKLLEKIIQKQFTAYSQQYDLLSNAQYGFIPGQSTIINVLSCDAVIANAILEGHAYDIISFDFKSTCDKIPNRVVIAALVAKGVFM